MPLAPEYYPVASFPQVPAFIVSPEQISILHSPDEFYNSLLSRIKGAKKRIVLSALYIGNGPLATELVNALHEASSERNVQVLILMDASRSVRHSSVTSKYAGSTQIVSSCEHGPTSSCDLLAPLTALNKVSVSLYHNPTLRGWLYTLLPARINEVVGVQHIKAFVFDDTVMLSGANLSQEYFTHRQDRYWIFEKQAALADFFAGLISVISQFCYQLCPDGTLLPSSETTDPMKANLVEYKARFSNAVMAFMAEMSQLHPPSNGSTADTICYPLIQCGPIGIRTEEHFTTWLLNHISTSHESSHYYHVALASGYFNLTNAYEQLLTNCTRIHGCQMLHLLCAAPTANGFLNSQGVSGYIPLAYRESLIGLLTRLSTTTQHRSEASFTLPKVMEFCKPGWTFHAKGLWITKMRSNGSLLSSTTLIGSSNFSYRSLNRDLESQLAVWTKNAQLQRRMAEEREHLFSASVCNLVSLSQLTSQSNYRLPWYLRFLYPVLHIFM